MGLVTVGGGAGLGWVNASTYGALGDGTTDDTTALQDAIDATPEGGTLYLPRGLYKTTAELVIDKAMTVQGAGVHELWGSTSDTKFSCLLPTQSPYLAGAVLMPSTAGQNAINITVAGLAVHLRDFGVLFASAIQFSDTGDGVFARGPSQASGYDNGVMSGTIQRVSVYGHDGDHYGFHLVNPMQMTLDHVRAFGGGTLRLLNYAGSVGFDSAPINYGNIVVNHLSGVLICAGTAHGISLESTAGTLNLMQFNRPQIWSYDVTDILDVTPPADPQKNWNVAGDVRRFSVLQPDSETQMDLDTEWPTEGAFIDPAGANGNTPYAIFRPSASTFGDRSDARALWWNLDLHVLQHTDTAEEWGIYDTVTDKFVLSADVGPSAGGVYTGRGATGARPATPAEGEQFYDLTIHKPIFWNGSNWKDGSGTTV